VEDMCNERRRTEACVDVCGLVCPSRTSERGGEGDCVKEGGGGGGEREMQRELGLPLDLCHSPVLCPVCVPVCVCVFITAGPNTKLFACVWGGYWRTCATRDDEPRPVWTSLPITH
jgi:hypothetical protein